MGKKVAEVYDKQENLKEKAELIKQDSEKKSQNAQLPPVKNNQKVERSKSGFWFGIIILLLVLILAGGGFFFLQQLRDQQEDIGGEVGKGDMRVIELTKQITGYQSQLSALQSQLANLETEISGRDKFYNEKLSEFSNLQQDKIDTTVNSLNNSMGLIKRQLGKTRGDWLMADAEYLLSIANQRLLLVGDINTTIEALIAADQRLRESGDAAAYKVRQQIAKEIAELRKIVLPDIVGIFSSLQLLVENVDKLATLLPYEGKEMTQTEHKKEVQQDDHTHDLLDSALIELEGLVTIRHTEQPITEILTVEQAKFLKEELKVKLEIIKLALVQQNNKLFKIAIDDANSWLAEHFINNKDSDSFNKQLTKLKSIQVKDDFPDVSKSLKMLRDIVKLRIDTDSALEEPKEQKSKVTSELPPEKSSKGVPEPASVKENQE